MKKYLQTILLFDVALPAFAIGLPCCVLFWAVLHSENVASEKALQRAAFDEQVQQVTVLKGRLEPLKEKVKLLKALLSSEDIEAKLGSGIAAELEKLSPDAVEETLHDFQYGTSAIGPNYGEGRRLTLKLSSRWETLNTATEEWETRFPNLVLESISIDPVPATALSAPYLQAALSYFVITEN
jgi:hypothetical protein